MVKTECATALPAGEDVSILFFTIASFNDAPQCLHERSPSDLITFVQPQYSQSIYVSVGRDEYDVPEYDELDDPPKSRSNKSVPDEL